VRLADAGVAADQHDAALDDAAAQHPVEFLMAGGRALDGPPRRSRQHRHRRGAGQRGKRFFPAPPASATDSTSVFQAPQAGHLPSHFGLVAAAFAAGVDTGTRCASAHISS
jgi:hypothetical protein